MWNNPRVTASDDLRVEIRAFLRESGMSERGLSERAGLNPQAVQQILAGRSRSPRTDTVEKLRAAMAPRDSARGGLAALDPAEAVAPAPEVAPAALQARVAPAEDVPVYGVAEGGEDGAFVINLAEGPLDYAARPARLERARNVFAVTVQGASMEPVWRAGDLVFCQSQRGYGPGDYVLVQVEAGPGEPPLAFVKLFVRHDDGRMVLSQHNPPREMGIPRASVKAVFRAFHWRELGA